MTVNNLARDEFPSRLIEGAERAGPAQRASVGLADFAAVIYPFTALAAYDSRAGMSGSVHLAQADLHNVDCKQLFVGRFAIGEHLACFLVVDLRMTLVS
jgi:hypothetical protein